jgi:hypothetical protein
MTAIVLPDIDRTTLNELRKRIPDLSEIELPSLPSKKEVGRTADQAIDRLLGRRRTPIWAWVAVAIGLAAAVGVIAAWFAWFRRPTGESTSESEPWTDQAAAGSTEPGGASPDPWPTTETGDSFDRPLATASVRTTVSAMRSPVGSRAGGQRSSVAIDDEIASGTPPYPIEEA